MSGKHCPKCEQDIGLMAVMKAMLPSRLFCPHCATPLRYIKVPWWPIVITAAAYLLALALAYPLVVKAAAQVALPVTGVYVILALVSWQPFELIIALYLRARGVLLFR